MKGIRVEILKYLLHRSIVGIIGADTELGLLVWDIKGFKVFCSIRILEKF
jgi:hypothetical protein